MIIRLAVPLPYFKSKYTRSCLIVGSLEAATKSNSALGGCRLGQGPKLWGYPSAVVVMHDYILHYVRCKRIHAALIIARKGLRSYLYRHFETRRRSSLGALIIPRATVKYDHFDHLLLHYISEPNKQRCLVGLYL